MTSDSRSSRVVPAVLVLASTVGLACLALRPADGRTGHVAAMFPPWWNAVNTLGAVAAADGRVVRLGAWPSLLTVSGADAGLADRLRAAGAWLVVDATALIGCSVPDAGPR